MSVAPYLLLAAVVIFLLEVIERRMGLLSARWLPRRLLPRVVTERVRSWTAFVQKAGASKAPVKPSARPQAAEPAAGAAAYKPPAQKETPAGGMLDALTHAQQRARKRTERR